MSTVGLDQRPHATDQDYLVSWNNKQAPGWAAADDKFSYGPVFRSQMIERRVKDAIAGGRVTLAQLVQSMDEPSTQDLQAWALMPILRNALGNPSDPRLRNAINLLSTWAANGAHRRDLDRNGSDEDSDAIALMDAWWPRLVRAEFWPSLGDTGYQALTTMLRPASVMAGDPPAAPDYDDGWWGFVSKDLRGIFAPKSVTGAWSRGYCGGGNQAKCRQALQDSLSEALNVTKQQLYGQGDCADRPDPACYDQNRWTVASAVSVPPFPFQNRPTFQQTAAPSQHVPR